MSCLATKWETKNDDYGRVYYANWETGEAVYEPPAEMAYRPPLGRNELGEKVDPRLQALRSVDCLTAARWQHEVERALNRNTQKHDRKRRRTDEGGYISWSQCARQTNVHCQARNYFTARAYYRQDNSASRRVENCTRPLTTFPHPTANPTRRRERKLIVTPPRQRVATRHGRLGEAVLAERAQW